MRTLTPFDETESPSPTVTWSSGGLKPFDAVESRGNANRCCPCWSSACPGSADDCRGCDYTSSTAVVSQAGGVDALAGQVAVGAADVEASTVDPVDKAVIFVRLDGTALNRQTGGGRLVGGASMKSWSEYQPRRTRCKRRYASGRCAPRFGATGASS